MKKSVDKGLGLPGRFMVKAKGVNTKEWVEGYLLVDEFGQCTVSVQERLTDGEAYLVSYVVDSNSIRDSANVKDADGNRIYCGDLLRCLDDKDCFIYIEDSVHSIYSLPKIKKYWKDPNGVFHSREKLMAFDIQFGKDCVVIGTGEDNSVGFRKPVVEKDYWVDAAY